MYYNPKQNVCMDEMMIKHTRKCTPICRYIKAKPSQYDWKIWCLANCESKYVQRIEIYCGASDSQEEANVGGRVVLNLMSVLESKAHIVTCDNFFTSPCGL